MEGVVQLDNAEAVSADLEVISSGYRLVSDDRAFADCVVPRTRKLNVAEAALREPDLDKDALITEYTSGVRGLLEKLTGPEELSYVEEAISDVAAAAMVVTTRGVVVAAKIDGHKRFDAVKGQENLLGWLDPLSRQDFQSVLSSAKSGEDHKHAIVRTLNSGNARGIAEAFTLRDKSSEKLSSFTTEEIPGAGFFFVHEKPDVFADHLARIVLD